MEKLAIGISSTAVQELVKRVKNAKEEEAKQWQTVERDIVFMKHEFEMMQSFLASADGEGRFRGDEVARTWVRQVQHLSDGAEDCIDFVLHLDTERSFWTFCLRVLPSCMTGGAVLPHLDKAVSDIEQLRAMVEDVSKRNIRYSGLGSGDYSGSGSKPVPVAGRLQLGSSAASASTLLDIFVNPSDARKDKDATECLIGLVAAPDHADLRIFSVCGTGGDLGTISIARKVYEDPEFCSKFPLRAWVKLTQPFDPLGFIRSLVDQFEANSRRQQGTRFVVAAAAQKPPPEQLLAKFFDDICNIEYLIVLEDVRSMAEWDAARAFLPDVENKGSRVIVLTHQLEIASLCIGQPYEVSLLREFSPHHSVYVFYQDKKHTCWATDPTREPQDSEQQPMATAVSTDAQDSVCEQQARPTVVVTEAQDSGSGGEQQAKPMAVISEAQASDEQKAWPVAEITEAQASGEQQTKPTTTVITEVQASGKQHVKPATAAEIMEAEASGDRLRSHCNESFDSQHTRATDPTREPQDCEQLAMATAVSTDAQDSVCEQQARPTAVVTEAQDSGSSGEQQAKPTGVISEAQASSEQKARPAAEITEAHASGEQQTKPMAAVITEVQASGKQHVKPATAAEIMEAEASGDRLRSHCNEGFDSQHTRATDPTREPQDCEQLAMATAMSTDAQDSVCEQQARPTEVQASGKQQVKPATAVEIMEAEASGDRIRSHCSMGFDSQGGEQQAKPTGVISEAQASGEHKARPAAEITEAHAFGEQQTKPTAAVITEAQASGKQQFKPAMAAEIMEAEASGDRLRSHCSVGFDSQVKKLEELITYSPDGRNKHRVVSVCGIAGAGKSSVVKTIYDRCLERMTQESSWSARYAWVMVPNNPFRIKEFCRRLHWIMKSGPLHEDSASIVSECIMELYLYWNLIVIDGLQSKADWDLIKTELDLAKFGNCIILVTNELVAKECVADQDDVYNFSDQGDLHRPLQYQCDDDNWIRQRGSSRLADAYNWLCSNCLVGRDFSEEKKLEELITSADRSDKHHVISVCGLPGAGKSFIVKTIYYSCIQLETLEDLFGEYAWVNVPDPFDIMVFCQRLFCCWRTALLESEMGLNFVGECSKLMHQKQRFLLVIDGLQSTNDWNPMLQARLPLATCTSCIVVVTRYQTVARHCATSEDEICIITSLKEDATRRLIRDQIVQQLCEVPGTSEPDPEIINQVLAIANKCGRSPEVVRALGTYLLSKQGAAATKIAALRHLNDNFMQELRANPDLGRLLTVFTSMHSNIHDCPQFIKKCIFYLSIFHQGSSIIRRDRLVRRWIAEGYSEGIDSISMAVYTETNLFHKLAELGMMSKPAAAQSSTVAAVNSSGTMRMSSCQVNSFCLEYITMRETEESIFVPLEVTVLEGGRSPPMTQHVGQHLAIRDWKGEKAVFDCLDFTTLRSLTVSGQWQPFYVSDMMLVLRVLDLEGTTSNLSDGDLKEIVERLPRLKFLSIRRCKEITRLPRSVGGLRQLQTLDVRGTKIVRLPGSIVKLQKLQYLRAGADDGQGGGVRVPGGIGALKALHTLGAIDVSSSCTGVAILNKLHRLQQLRKLHVSGIIKKRHNRLCVCVACFVSGGQACSSCSISFPTNSFGELKVLEIACSPRMHLQFAEGAVPKLEKVKLYCHDGHSPQFSGLKFLKSSLKQILLKGTGCNAVRNELKKQLDQQIPNNQIVLAIAQGHESQPEPSLAEGNQQISESNPSAEGNQDIGVKPSRG